MFKLVAFSEYFFVEGVHDGVVLILDGFLAILFLKGFFGDVGLGFGFGFEPLFEGEVVGVTVAVLLLIRLFHFN